jgi:hypothetical protein
MNSTIVQLKPVFLHRYRNTSMECECSTQFLPKGWARLGVCGEFVPLISVTRVKIHKSMILLFSFTLQCCFWNEKSFASRARQSWHGTKGSLLVLRSLCAFAPVKQRPQQVVPDCLMDKIFKNFKIVQFIITALKSIPKLVIDYKISKTKEFGCNML